MHPRLSPWFTLFAAIFLGVGLACAAQITLPLNATGLPPTPTAAPSQIPSVSPTLALPLASATQCPNGSCAKACVAQLNSIAQTGGAPEARPRTTGQAPSGAVATVLVTYPVNGDQLGAPDYAAKVPADLSALQHNTSVQQDIWDYFVAMIPASQRTEVAYYIVSTDGKDGMLASVEQFSGQSQVWALVVDPADAGKPRDLTFTLLHEFGHLLTLNASQVKPSEAVLDHPNDLQIYDREMASCPRYFASGGCSRPNSYINQFYNQFWTSIFDEWSTVNAARSSPEYLTLLAHFYGEHHAQFITPYASTSPEEDMAETWAYFVLNPKPPADSIAHRKVLFFYDFPQLVALRNQIVSGICTYAATH